MPAHTSDMQTDLTASRPVFDIIGGETAVRALVDAFYDRMDADAAFAGIRRLHPTDLAGSRDKLFWFLCGWMGGPEYFVERFGHPRLRARHLPFAIASAERDQWLACMQQAMSQRGVPEDLQQRLMRSLFQTADWMRNQPDP